MRSYSLALDINNLTALESQRSNCLFHLLHYCSQPSESREPEGSAPGGSPRKRMLPRTRACDILLPDTDLLSMQVRPIDHS